jgi:SAM-dependent methyltransferase
MGCDIEESINADIQDFFVVDEQLPLLDNSIDALISNSVLEHLRDPQAALSEYHRVLKPNGILYIQTNFLYQEHGNPHDYLRFTLEMLRYLTTTNGFTVLESSKIGSRFALIIDNASANYANRMSKILQFFFQFDSIKRLLLLLPFLLFTIITTVIGTVTFLGLVVLRIYGNLPRFRNHAFYPGVFVKAKK